MKTFEMPKMTVAIFSLEDVITASGETVKNLEVAQAELAKVGVTEANTTATTAADWVAAN